MKVVKKVKDTASSWYMRYLLATELYMVEPWEKVVFHIFISILFWILWCFNYKLVIDTVGTFTTGGTPETGEIMST